MATPISSVTEYCGLVARSGLIREAEIKALYRRWKTASAAGDDDVAGFRDYLVAQKQLTRYQAGMIQRGHADGFTVGNYIILDRIGKGQSAGVYKAKHSSGQEVAIKVLPGSRAKQPGVLTRFQREGRLLTQLDHPNVVRAFQVGHAGHLHFIAMEYLEGETLDEVLARRKRLPTEEAVRLVYQALLGVQHLHERRMVHRDLKPSNLFVSPPPASGEADTTLAATVRVLDIGIGREMFDEESADTRDMDLTSEGTVLGTPDYLAPEQARDARSADVRSDIYSLGCVLYHLVSGRPPFPDKTVMGQMVKHAIEPLPPLAAFSPGLRAVLDKMTAKKPDERYQLPAEAATALAPFLPAGAPGAVGSRVLPEFQEWLDSESGTEEIPPEVKELAANPPAPRPMQPVVQAPSWPVPQPISPTPSPPSSTGDLMIDVELVELPQAPASEPAYLPAPPLWELGRRDFIMLGLGAAAVLIAIGMGVGLATALRPKVAAEPTTVSTEPK